MARTEQIGNANGAEPRPLSPINRLIRSQAIEGVRRRRDFSFRLGQQRGEIKNQVADLST